MRKRLKVRITKRLKGSPTQNKYKLDETGRMLGMAGRIHQLEFDVSEDFFRSGRGSIDIYCEPAGRSFTFSKQDLTLITDEPLQPLPEPESFDPKQLDI